MTIVDTKDQVAQKLIDWHFQIEPETEEIYRFLAVDEDDAKEPIKLLEVSRATPATGEIMTFTFGPADDITFASTIAEITPDELELVRQDVIKLPHGWSFARSRKFKRPRNKDGNG
jgi:hypothetical protein